MKINLKSFISGIIIGTLIASTVSVFAITLKITNNNYPIYVNGQKQEIDGYNINGNTYLGLSATATALDASVKYNKDKKSIEINSINKDNPKKNLDEGITDQKIDGLNIYQKNGEQYVAFMDITGALVNKIRTENSKTIYISTDYTEYDNPQKIGDNILNVKDFSLYIAKIDLKSGKDIEQGVIVRKIPCIYIYHQTSNSYAQCVSLDNYKKYFQTLWNQTTQQILDTHKI